MSREPRAAQVWVARDSAASQTEWPQKDGGKKVGIPFKSANLAKMLNDQSEYVIEAVRERRLVLREFLFPKVDAGRDVSPKAVGKALKHNVGNPVKAGDRMLKLTTWEDTDAKSAVFKVEVKQ